MILDIDIGVYCFSHIMVEIKYILGTIHLRHRHFLVGEGVKNWPNLPTDSSKNCQREGVGVKNSENLPTS